MRVMSASGILVSRWGCGCVVVCVVVCVSGMAGVVGWVLERRRK
jgi:hypothetical protein